MQKKRARSEIIQFYTFLFENRRRRSLPAGNDQLHVAAEIVQIPVGGGAEPQAGAAVPACQLHRVPADLHAVIVAAAAAGDTVGPGGDVLELRT